MTVSTDELLLSTKDRAALVWCAANVHTSEWGTDNDEARTNQQYASLSCNEKHFLLFAGWSCVLQLHLYYAFALLIQFVCTVKWLCLVVHV